MKKSELPMGWSLEAADFINKCLQRKPANRIGLSGPAEVKSHIWFRGFSWKDLLEKKLEPPFIPTPRPPIQDKPHELDANEAMEKINLLRLEETQAQFKDYEYDLEQLRFDLKTQAIKHSQLSNQTMQTSQTLATQT